MLVGSNAATALASRSEGGDGVAGTDADAAVAGADSSEGDGPVLGHGEINVGSGDEATSTSGVEGEVVGWGRGKPVAATDDVGPPQPAIAAAKTRAASHRNRAISPSSLYAVRSTGAIVCCMSTKSSRAFQPVARQKACPSAFSL